MINYNNDIVSIYIMLKIENADLDEEVKIERGFKLAPEKVIETKSLIIILWENVAVFVDGPIFSKIGLIFFLYLFVWIFL